MINVSMEQAQCPVCLKLFDTGAILFARSLNRKLKDRMVTHFEMCPEHQKLKDDGFVALVELEREPRGDEDPLHAPRTGRIAHIRAEAWPKIMNVPVPPKMLCVVEKGVIDKL